LEDLIKNPVFLGVASAVIGFLAKWLWDRFWHSRDASKKADAEVVKGHSVTLIALDKRVEAGELLERERQKALGRMEGEIQRLDGKVSGLQTFWTTKFEKMEERVEAKIEAIRTEIRSDQKAHEQRMTDSLEAHQKRVHDRLNEATAAQASMLNELIDKLVDKATDENGEPKVT
jgi:predicted HicB family RNase H-like nuclease